MKKKKRLELLGGQPGDEDSGHDQYSASNFDVSEPKEKIPAIKEIDQS